MNWFTGKDNNKSKTSDRGNEQMGSATPLHGDTPMIIVYWNAAAGFALGFPLLLYFVVKIFSGRGEGGGNGGWFGSGWFNDGPEEERWQGLGSTLAYFWACAVFGILVWRGNRALQLDRDIRALFVALVVFTNLAFLCWILVATGNRRRGGEDEVWMGQFSSVEILTFMFMTLFAIVFSVWVYDSARANTPTASSSYSLWGNNNRNNDNDGII